MIKKITWKTGNGQDVEFIAELQTNRVIGHDDMVGEIIKPCCEIVYRATVSGRDVGGYSDLESVFGHPVVVAKLGILGIAQTNLDRIQLAVADLKASDYWRNWQLKTEAGEKLEDDYRAHVERVNKMMNP